MVYRMVTGLKYCSLALLLILSVSRVWAGLLDDVQKLNLGLSGYTIGQQLSAQKKEFAQKHLVKDAYEGTYKFADQGLYVVVEKKSDRILALYKRVTDADEKQLKEMVMELMDRFAEPTTMAHDKILYWAFTKNGPVSEDEFEKAKKSKQTRALGIIATVKLNSTMEISPDKEGETGEHEQEKGTVYYIITSDPLVQEFLQSE